MYGLHVVKSPRIRLGEGVKVRPVWILHMIFIKSLKTRKNTQKLGKISRKTHKKVAHLEKYSPKNWIPEANIFRLRGWGED